MTTYLAVDFGSTINNGLSTVATFIPALVLFVIVMLIGWLIARILRTVLAKVLSKIGFDRVAERGGINRFLGNNTASWLVAQIVFFAVLLFSLQLALRAFGANPVTNLISGVVNFLPKLFVAILIVVVAAAIGRAVHGVVVGGLGGVSYGNIIGRIAQFFIIGMGIIAALNQIQVASSVVEPVFIAVLAIIVGVAIVGVGGGLIGPMRQRWERMLTRAEGEAGSVQESIRSRSARHDVQADRAGAESAGAERAGTQAGEAGGTDQPTRSMPSRSPHGHGPHGLHPSSPPTDPGFGDPGRGGPST